MPSRGLHAAEKLARTRKLFFPKCGALFDLRWLPKRALCCAPCGVRERHGRKRFPNASQAHHVCHAQILNENSQCPAVSDRVMDGKHQHMIVGGAPQQFDSIQRAMHEIEWGAKGLRGDFFERLCAAFRRRKFAKMERRLGGCADHLHGPFFAG